MLSAKQNAKQKSITVDPTSNLNCSLPSDLAGKSQPQFSWGDSLASAAATKDGTVRACKTEKCGENTFRSVTDLSLSAEKLSGLGTIDLDKALKGLVASEPPAPTLTADSSDKIGDIISANSGSEFHVPGKKTPLDFTLKTTMRVLSSSSVNWFHRLITCGPCNGMPQFANELGYSGYQRMSGSTEFHSSQLANPRAPYSWVYPHSSLPPSIMSMLNLSALEEVQMDFLSKRQVAWEDAFRSLYYMLRKNACDIFYVCTAQFVVLFTGYDGSMEGKRACHAYISQSTRGLRSLLREHDICFSMPLCHSKVEEVTTEDLVELSEIEKHNLGQIRRQNSMSDVDNSEQSLLAFSGNKDVHGLYDFLLNYRHFLKSLASIDVPVLYSPVPFQNAALSAPEVRCKEVKRADYISLPLKEFSIKDEFDEGSPAGFCYSIEFKDTYLPPWVISNVCEAIGSKATSFEASFVTDPTSNGLNVVLGTILEKLDSLPSGHVSHEEHGHAFRIPNAIVSPHLRSAFLKGLKYRNGSYTASISSL